MDDPLVLVAAAGGVGLFALWVAHLRRDLARRSARASEFDGVEAQGQLWTSAARCPECHAGGALLSRDEGPDGEELWHTCLTCGHRHRRDHRG